MKVESVIIELLKNKPVIRGIIYHLFVTFVDMNGNVALIVIFTEEMDA